MDSPLTNEALRRRSSQPGLPGSAHSYRRQALPTYEHGLFSGSAARSRAGRRMFLALGLLILAYLSIVTYGNWVSALPFTAIWKSDVSLTVPPACAPVPAASTASTAPGFQSAPHSCAISDMLDDPLVKEYGQNNIRLSRTYEGSGTRVRRMLAKAVSGQPIHIAVVGGSVSWVSGVLIAS